MSKPHLHTLHTVWIYWPDDDAIEMHGAVDEHLLDANPDFYAQMLGFPAV